MKRLPINYGFSSHAIHAGELTDDICQAHVPPIYQTSTFCFKDIEQGQRQFTGKEKGYIYSRWYNPTVEAIEEKVAALEGMELRQQAPSSSSGQAPSSSSGQAPSSSSGQALRHGPGQAPKGDSYAEVAGLAFSSGMAAISTLLFTLLRPGDTVVTHGGLYGGTTELIEKLLKEMEISHMLVHMDTPEKVETAIKETERLGLIYLETPANPTLDMCDIALICEIAHAHGLRVVVDNTFATPILQQPLALGADYVVHSTTKYLNGHGTTVGGMVVSRELDFVRNNLWSHKELMGGSPSPFDAWLINQGLKTLALRMERHCANAMAVARWLDQHPKVAYVAYPGLEHFHQHELARRQMKGFGGIISFELKGGLEAGVTVMNNVFLCTLAVSLGTVDTLIQHPASMTHASVSPEEREAFGITDGLVRLSVGIEDVEDIIDDLDRALGKI